jgi:hypothetical protein
MFYALAVDQQQPHLCLRRDVKLDHTYATTPAAAGNRPVHLAQSTGALDDIAGLRIV